MRERVFLLDNMLRNVSKISSKFICIFELENWSLFLLNQKLDLKAYIITYCMHTYLHEILIKYKHTQTIKSQIKNIFTLLCELF